jgi:glycerate 2-kinase
MAYRIVLAFDSFKGSVSATEACRAAAEGAARSGAECLECPLSDGGEGFVEALVSAAHGTLVQIEVTGPLFEKVAAQVGLIDGGRTAVVEAAQACGLGLVPASRRNPMQTTSRGVGEMLLYTASLGVERVVLGLGGTVTNDGGMGMLSALGWRFLDRDGRELPPIGASLEAVAQIKRGNEPNVEIVIASDVTNPLFGPEGAACIFAPQKGATPSEVECLDAGLRNLAKMTFSDLAQVPGAGAAGGLGFALHAFLHGSMESGAELALNLVGLPEILKRADLCLTGEGRTDGQTVRGKLPAAVVGACRRAGVPCVCVSGTTGAGWQGILELGCAEVVTLARDPSDEAQSIAEALRRIADAAERLARVYRAGGRDEENRRS